MTRCPVADDPEATAMQQLTQSLTPLDEPARERSTRMGSQALRVRDRVRRRL